MGFDTEQKELPSLEELLAKINQLENKLNELYSKQNNPNKADQYLDIASTCQYLGMGRTTLYDIMNKGLLAYTYIGRQRRVLLSDIKKYINSTYVASKQSIL
jgi:excisionase family DNA binding protein